MSDSLGLGLDVSKVLHMGERKFWRDNRYTHNLDGFTCVGR